MLHYIFYTCKANTGHRLVYIVHLYVPSVIRRCRGKNGTKTEESRKEAVGQVRHFRCDQPPAFVPTKTNQVHLALLGF